MGYKIMASDAVKIAQIKARAERELALAKIFERTVDLLSNPVIDVVAATVLIEYLQGHKDPNTGERVAGGGFVGSIAGSALEAGLIAYLVAPTIASVTSNMKEVATAIAPAITPLLLAAGGA